MAAGAGAFVGIQRARRYQQAMLYPSYCHASNVARWAFPASEPAFEFVEVEDAALRERRQQAQASYELLVSIPTHLFEEGERPGECAVCLSTFAEGEKLKTLPCPGRHRFHTRCLRACLQHKESCPVCRFELCERVDPESTADAANGRRSWPAGGPARARAAVSVEHDGLLARQLHFALNG